MSWKTQARFPMYRPDRVCCAQSKQNLRKPQRYKLRDDFVWAVDAKKVCQMCKHCGLHGRQWYLCRLELSYFGHKDLLYDILGLTTIEPVINRTMVEE